MSFPHSLWNSESKFTFKIKIATFKGAAQIFMFFLCVFVLLVKIIILTKTDYLNFLIDLPINDFAFV